MKMEMSRYRMLLLPHPSGFIINIFCGPLAENDDVKATDERCAGFNPDIAFGPLTENDDVKAADERCAGFNPDIAFGPLTENADTQRTSTIILVGRIKIIFSKRRWPPTQWPLALRRCKSAAPELRFLPFVCHHIHAQRTTLRGARALTERCGNYRNSSQLQREIKRKPHIRSPPSR